MTSCISAQMCSYVRTLFEHPSKWYESYQENGTKYLKSRRVLEDDLQQQLNACAGEIFLCGIPPDTQAEKIAEVASLVGELYILRFKVHFSGDSRGFAYLQYMNPKLMELALQKLPMLFRMLNLPKIKVCTSRNSSKLLLRKAFDMAPSMVYETLSKLINFSKLEGHELSPGYFEYQIIFKCNEEAVHARREILKSILKFGPRAIIVWDGASRSHNYEFKSAMLKRNLNQKLDFSLRRNQLVPTNANNFTPNLQKNDSFNNFVHKLSNMNLA